VRKDDVIMYKEESEKEIVVLPSKIRGMTISVVDDGDDDECDSTGLPREFSDMKNTFIYNRD